MKTNKFLTLLLALIASIAMTSCVEDDDFSIPNSIGDEENAAVQKILAEIASGDLTEISISDAKNLFNGSSPLPYEVTTNIVLKGYVSSSDQTGNFFREIYLQDALENPTAGIQVTFNLTDSYNKFNVGREVYIRLNGLFIGETRNGNGITTIGGSTETSSFGTTVDQLTENQINATMFRSEITGTIIPLPVSFSALGNNLIGVFVQVDNAEFLPSLEGESYLDPLDDFDTQRIMQACEGFDYSTFILETSSFADFANVALPTGNGSVKGVITRNFSGDDLIMNLNSVADVDFSGERCTLLDINDFDVVFEEDFTGGQGSWEVTNTVGTRDWDAASFSGESYMRASAFQGGGNPFADMVSWLISPSIDFDAQDNEQLIIEIADAFSNGQPLKAFYSENYTTGSDPSNATWIEIGTNQIEGLNQNTGFFDNNYEATGLIDLSMVSGNSFIAFVYSSNGATVSTTIDLSDVKILAQ